MKKIILSIFISLANIISFAALKLPSIIADNMILQQDKPNNIWGWAMPGAEVHVFFMNKNYTSLANQHGEWKVSLNPSKAGKASDMKITADKEQILIKNILIGEVWLCSGQSNMEYPLGGFKDLYANEIQTSGDDDLRYVVIKDEFDNRENKDVALKNSWLSVNSATVQNCSAVAYFFAKQLREKLHVPVGLIVSSWGGTPAQSWMDTTALKSFSDYMELYDGKIRPIDFSKFQELKKHNEEVYQQKVIIAYTNFKDLTDLNYNDHDWEKMNLPKNWESLGHPDLDGIATYRISFTVPRGYENKTAILHLPAIDDVDSTYVNGVFVGSQTVWNELRTYNVPTNTLKEGKNVITIWVEDDGGGGGMNEDSDNYYLQVGDQKISLKGEARFKILAAKENIADGINYAAMQNQPAVLFNAMIAPLLPYSIRGVIWYQGESNTGNYVEYRTLFPSLINCWRKRFDQKELPFLFVQLSSYNPAVTEPAISNWAGLREAQTYALKLPATGMAVTIDVGDQKDIHPKRKKEVGYRLAANAFNIVYGFQQDIPAGPAYKSFSIEGNTIKINYSNIGTGLVKKGDLLLGFSIAGADKHFITATATIKGNEVIVSNPLIASPLNVRYAWADAPMDANLYNKEDFPAAPFRTDKD
ncbi:MAG: sialate O-acetylesterase [Ferruginibacter sp.]